ncbi:MAG: hypothetical protein ACRCU6_00205 [Fusobacteriaceae bacterium]
MKKIIARETTLSQIFGITERRVRDVCGEFKAGTGKYFLLDSVKEYIKNLKDEGKEEITALRKADKELKEYRLEILKRNHVPIDQVELAITDMQIRTKSKAMSIANKASLEVMGKTNRKEIELIIQKHVNEFLEEMANLELEE